MTEVDLNDDLVAKLEKHVEDTGRTVAEVIEDEMYGCLDAADAEPADYTRGGGSR